MNTSKNHNLSKRVDWHAALSAAVKINLKDYEEIKLTQIAELLLKITQTGYIIYVEVDFMCEAIFELFGTSSEEIAENAAKEATEKANKKIEALTQKNALLQELLIQNGIPLPE